jgi:hypothetical protein
MLVALLLQAIIAQPPAPPPEALVRDLERVDQVRAIRARCNQGLIYTREGLVDGASLYRPQQNPARAQEPLWKPGQFPDEGVYAAVERRVDGCPVPTPISVPSMKLKGR